MSSGGCLPPPPYGASPLHRSASVPIGLIIHSLCNRAVRAYLLIEINEIIFRPQPLNRLVSVPTFKCRCRRRRLAPVLRSTVPPSVGLLERLQVLLPALRDQLHIKVFPRIRSKVDPVCFSRVPVIYIYIYYTFLLFMHRYGTYVCIWRTLMRSIYILYKKNSQLIAV